MEYGFPTLDTQFNYTIPNYTVPPEQRKAGQGIIGPPRPAFRACGPGVHMRRTPAGARRKRFVHCIRCPSPLTACADHLTRKPGTERKPFPVQHRDRLQGTARSESRLPDCQNIGL